MQGEISEGGKNNPNALYWNLVIMTNSNKHFCGYQNHGAASVKINLHFNI